MSLNRDDMLRELELLPVWRMRTPPVLDISTAPHTQAVAEPAGMIVAEETPAAAVMPGPVAETAQAATIQQLPGPGQIAVRLPMDTPSSPAWQPEIHADEQVPLQPLDTPHVDHDASMEEAPLPEPVAEIATVELEVALLVESTWLLYTPAPGHAHSMQLLQNIVQALQLPADELGVHHNPLQRQQVSSRFCVLFGLAAANQFLGAEYDNITDVRGELHTFGDMYCVITHDLESLLQTPVLKREVWHDLCLLLAKKNEVLA
ncbi:hypothetical protein [Methylophilus sp. 3sh_L]|uniref:hypothetical protein n=1 Tax=Methylophilus sp. 3sh_L TaxID=3377114 RepID=UPI00398EF2AC